MVIINNFFVTLQPVFHNITRNEKIHKFDFGGLCNRNSGSMLHERGAICRSCVVCLRTLGDSLVQMAVVHRDGRFLHRLEIVRLAMADAASKWNRHIPCRYAWDRYESRRGRSDVGGCPRGKRICRMHSPRHRMRIHHVGIGEICTSREMDSINLGNPYIRDMRFSPLHSRYSLLHSRSHGRDAPCMDRHSVGKFHRMQSSGL